MATQPFLGVRTTAFSHSWYPFSCPAAYWPFRREKEFSDEEMPTPSSFIIYQDSQRFRYRGNTATLEKKGQGVAVRDRIGSLKETTLKQTVLAHLLAKARLSAAQAAIYTITRLNFRKA